MKHSIKSLDPHSGVEFNTELLGEIIQSTMPYNILTEILGIINYEMATKRFDIESCDWICESQYYGEKATIPYNEVKATREELLSKFN